MSLSIGTKLGDLERRNSPSRRVILPNSVVFGADYVKVVDDTPTFLCSGNVGQKSSFGEIYHL